MQELKKEFILNFIEDNRWKYIVDGLKITLIVTIFAVLIGVLLGFLIAIVRTTHDKTGKLKILNVICRVYLTVIRGTPVVVQLMIIYFIIFGSVDIRYWLRSLHLVLTQVHMLQRFSVPVSCQSITDSLKQDEVWDSIMLRQ